ncbi:hypothetical protein DFH07DRAFT_851265 [Mycena maculata]|uniref:WD40 repeat-like protein n=1 Tax=Mycena maculata TaxID=230809 RepID=A0AAD7MQ99_9AGAR|nr:hypothetical protein DFH07DRAFT_851265 [Mycena maculata]
MSSVVKAAATLRQRMADFSSDPAAIEADSDDGHRLFLRLLGEACDLVRSQSAGHPDYEVAVTTANEILNEGVEMAYGNLDFDFLQSFAHSEEFPVLLGPHKDETTFSHRMSGLFDLMEGWMAKGTMTRPADSSLLPKLPAPWKTTPRPHPLSTLLSRFDRDVVGAHPSPFVASVYGARCEITSDSIEQPLSITNNGSCLAISSAGGYKNREPVLTYYLLDEIPPHRKQFSLTTHHAHVGLTEIAHASATDEAKKLIFVADTSRVKSYAWGSRRSDEVYDTAIPTHTLDTSGHRGPLHVLAPGRLIRAGKGSVGVWNLDALDTHGPDGSAQIGLEFDTSDSWRDEEDVIEPSSGSDSTGTISLADPQIAPGRWHAHPSLPATMLCGSDTDKSKEYSCIAVDLENGGKTVARYLGHGGETRAFSTSVADPNVFLTAASDGHARLYDQRMPLPTLTLRAGLGEDDCAGVVLVHPDGVPTVFTGAAHDQVIRLWDVRAQKMIYELSTGNNAVMGMTWDAPRCALYVATACDYMDRNGENFDYRRAKIARTSWEQEKMGDEEDDSMDEEDEDDSEDEYDDEAPCWPSNAAYAEDYFGHLFDAGDHRLLRYAFRDQADPTILPEYGDARLDMGPSW